MFMTLDISAVVPSEPGLALDQCYHRINPERVLNCLQSTLERGPYIAEPVAALHCITAKTWGPLNLPELRASLAMPGRQVVSWPGHL